MNEDIDFKIGLVGTINAGGEKSSSTSGLGDLYIPLTDGTNVYKIKVSQLKAFINP